MKLIDEEDDVRIGNCFIEHALDPFLKVTPVLGACDHRADLHAVNDLALDDVGNIVVCDLERESFCDRSLTDTGITYEAGVVLRAADQYLHDTVDLFLTSDDGIDLSLLGKFS